MRRGACVFRTWRTWNSRFARVVPAAYPTGVDEAPQEALADDRMAHLQLGELDLARMRGGVELIEDPVVERPMIDEFHRTQRMGDRLECIREAMRIVVHRIDAPGVPGTVVVTLLDAIQDRVAQSQHRGGHVDLGTQDPASLVELTGAHGTKELEILPCTAIAKRTLAARLGQRSLVRANLGSAPVVDESLSLADQVDREFKEPLEIVRGEIKMLFPIETQPPHIGLDRLHVFDVLGRGIRVVEAKVATTAREFVGKTKVQGDRHGVPDVEIAIGLRRESRDHVIVLARSQVLDHDRSDEIQPLGVGFCGHGPLPLVSTRLGYESPLPNVRRRPGRRRRLARKSRMTRAPFPDRSARTGGPGRKFPARREAEPGSRPAILSAFVPGAPFDAFSQ